MSIYIEKYKLKYSDIGKDNHLNLKSLIGYLQEVAGSHSSSVGYGLNDIPKTHIAWLVLDWKVKMFSHPKYNDEITIKTWARVLEKFYSYRDYEIYDNNNNLIAIASSKWIMLNTESGKIARVNDKMIKAYGIVEKSVFKEPLNEKPREPEELKLNFKYKIQRRDIDTNGHVNNINYISYAIETLPEDIYNSTEFNNIQIHYKKEIKYNDTIKCYYSFKNNKHVITIKSEDDSILHSIIKLY